MLRSRMLLSRSLRVITTDTRSAYRDLEARLRPFVARRVSVPADVDDVVQDVFLRMQRGLAGLRDDDRFGPWTYQIARSAIAEQRRARARHPLTDSAEHEQATGAPDAETDEIDLTPYVAGFVAMLPSPYREALTLTDLQGLPQKEAASMLGISLSAMKSRVQRGRERLRELIDRCCEIAVDPRGRVIACEPRAVAPCLSCEPGVRRA